MNRVSKRSKRNLEYVNKELVILVAYVLAISEVDFIVTEGYRPQIKQNKLYAQGRTEPGEIVTWTLKSKHTRGYAVDLYPYPIPKDLSNPPEGYREKQEYLRGLFIKCSEVLGIPLRVLKRDLPHFELRR